MVKMRWKHERTGEVANLNGSAEMERWYENRIQLRYVCKMSQPRDGKFKYHPMLIIVEIFNCSFSIVAFQGVVGAWVG